MRIKRIGACLIVVLLVVLPLSNTVSAEAVVGPPIGEQVVEFSPSDTVLPDTDVTVTIEWWITNEGYVDYTGPFNLNIDLKDSDGNEIEDWTIHDTTVIFDYQANASKPYIYEFTGSAPSEVDTYLLDVQIVANEIEKEVGKSCKSGKLYEPCKRHPLLVASEGGSLTTVPEFTTIAIPVAAILGLLFFFSRRKQRKE